MGHHTEHVFVPTNAKLPIEKIASLASEEYRSDSWNSGGASFGWNSKSGRIMTKARWSRASNDFEVTSDTTLYVPVVADEDAVTKETKAKFEMSGADVTVLQAHAAVQAQAAGGWVHGVYEAHTRLEALAEERFGADVSAVKVVPASKMKKAVATSTEGKAVTRYIVVSPTGRAIRDDFPTQAAARAAAVALMNTELGARYDSLSVEAFVVREDGNKSLVSIARPVPEKGNIEVIVTTSSVKPGAQMAGYMVSFDVHT